MFKLRVLTALVLVPLVVCGVIVLPEVWYAVALAAVLSVGAWEWARLAGFGQAWVRAAYVVFIAACMVLSGIGISEVDWALPVLLGLVLLWWVTALRLILAYEGRASTPIGTREGRDALYAARVVSRAAVGVVVLVAPWAALVALGSISPPDMPRLGRYLVLFLFVLMWVADSGAYFAGRRWGRHKLAPRVSPGKTWEGVWGGLAGAVAIAVLAGLAFDVTPRYLILFVALCLVTVAFSILGDLLESLFKRQAGLKDSSHLLPGHGGILDRIDSLTAAAPVFLLGLLALGLPR